MQCFCFFSESEDSFFSQTFCMIRKIDDDGIPISEPVSHFTEQIYVDSYYTEYHKPRIVMAQKLRDIDNVVSLFNHYRHEALNKEFFVQGIGRNLIEGRADLTLKEIGT